MYATRDELRGLDGLGDEDTIRDLDIDTAITIAKETIDDYTGTSFGSVDSPAYDSFTATISGEGLSTIRVKDEDGRPVLFIRTIDTVAIDGVEDDGISYQSDNTGRVLRSSGSFTKGVKNVVITGTAGRTDTPIQTIRWCARSIARNWLINLHSRVPDRALNLTTAEGSFEVRAQAGGVGRPTSMPDVNSELNRHRHRWDVG